MDVKSQVIEIIDELFMALASVFLYLNLDAMIGILLTRS